jgi:hypothetical protein
MPSYPTFSGFLANSASALQAVFSQNPNHRCSTNLKLSGDFRLVHAFVENRLIFASERNRKQNKTELFVLILLIITL